ncbi:hypothetical protein AX761_21995 [Rhizobium sp. 58]|nr:hypothetical protein AX761_21995 [Rhizobium sp. 58]
MSCTALPSEHITVIRDRLKDFVHGGKFFTSDELTALIRRMNTVAALAEEIEEENRLLGRQLRVSGALQRSGPAIVGPNVVAFPARRPDEGGSRP